MNAKFSTTVVQRSVPRFFVLGKGFAQRTQAFRALAKKEIAVYAAAYAKPAYVLEAKLKEQPTVKETLAWLFDDYQEGGIWLGDGSAYHDWVKARTAQLLNGAELMIKQGADKAVSVGPGDDDTYDMPQWEVGFKIGNPWPQEDSVLAILSEAGQLSA